jgi:hypothetical protein
MQNVFVFWHSAWSHAESMLDHNLFIMSQSSLPTRLILLCLHSNDVSVSLNIISVVSAGICHYFVIIFVIQCPLHFLFKSLLLAALLTQFVQQLALESVRTEYANAQLECNAADERAKVLAAEVILLEDKVLCSLVYLMSIMEHLENQPQQSGYSRYLMYAKCVNLSDVGTNPNNKQHLIHIST